MLLYNHPENSLLLWRAARDHLIGDIINSPHGIGLEPDDCYDIALKRIWAVLLSARFSPNTTSFPYTDPHENNFLPEPVNCPIPMPQIPPDSLNVDQRTAFDKIMAVTEGQGQKKLFFVNGCAGSGKTHLYIALGQEAERRGKSAFFTAFSGSASQALPLGMTCCSGFGIPTTISPDGGQPYSYLSYQHPTAERIRQASIIFIDEVTMMKERQLHVINMLLQVYIITTELITI